jgi:hypothetical protein
MLDLPVGGRPSIGGVVVPTERAVEMSSAVPPVVTRYLNAADDSSALAACFVEDGVVVDEGATYVGRAEIVAWRERAASRWTYTTEITGLSATGVDRYLVEAHLEGDFPGGVADLAFDFTVRDGLIASLAIG